MKPILTLLTVLLLTPQAAHTAPPVDNPRVVIASEAVKLDSDVTMMWAGGQYKYETVQKGKMNEISLPPDLPEVLFSVVYSGYVDVPRDGLYTFYANADDECRLYLDNEKVIDQSGRKVPPDLGMMELQGSRLLSRGLHKLSIDYTQMYHGYGLEVQWQGPGIPKQPIAPSYLKHKSQIPNDIF